MKDGDTPKKYDVEFKAPLRVWLHLPTRSPWAALTLTGLQRLAALAPG